MKEKAKIRRTSRATEHFKTVLMSVLLVSLILLVGIYISGMRLYESDASAAVGKNFDRLWSAQSGEAPEGLEKARLIPELIGYKQASSESASAAIADAAALSELYELTVPCILELFGSDSVCRQLSEPQGKYYFAQACGAEEFVYLRYHTPVLYQLIYAYAADKLTLSEGDVATGEGGTVGAYISELIIVPDKDFAAHRFVAYATDSAGGYYEFRPNEHIVSSAFYISKLASSAQKINTNGFSFATGQNFPSPEPIVKAELEVPSIISKPYKLGEKEREALLLLFDYNLDKLSGYEDEGGYIYIDTHSQLRVTDNSITFAADDATGGSTTLRGVRIDSLLGYTSSDTSGLFDKLTAVDTLIRKLSEISPALSGGEGRLCLGDVYSEGGLLVIEYFMTFNGVRVGTQPYFRAVLTEETLCEVSVRADMLVSGEDSVLLPSATYTLESLFSIGELDAHVKIDRVNMHYTENGAEWAVFLD